LGPVGRARSTSQKDARAVGVVSTLEPCGLESSQCWDLVLPEGMKGWAARDKEEGGGH
jgi:hypothetical protein